MPHLLILLLILSSGFVAHVRQQPPVRVVVTSQKLIRNRGHHPWNNRRVIFRATNEAQRPMVIYGFRDEEFFEPGGYLIEFHRQRGTWVYPTGATSDPGFVEQDELSQDKYVLQPGMSINFAAEMSSLEVGKRFRRTLYAAFDENEEPHEIRSEEFVLR